MATEDNGLEDLRRNVKELRAAIDLVRDKGGHWRMPEPVVSLPSEASSWNFTTFEKYISQRFGDLSLQLRERYEAQQTGVTAALAAAEKAVNAALIAAEKAVDKAEGAQQLRNEAQNEFRKSLSDLSSLMWTTKEGQAALDGLRREYLTGHSTLVDRVNKIETTHANLQGRIWAVGAVWAILVLVVMIAVRFIGHN
jgi:hypothetical protein